MVWRLQHHRFRAIHPRFRSSAQAPSLTTVPVPRDRALAEAFPRSNPLVRRTSKPARIPHQQEKELGKDREKQKRQLDKDMSAHKPMLDLQPTLRPLKLDHHRRLHQQTHTMSPESSDPHPIRLHAQIRHRYNILLLALLASQVHSEPFRKTIVRGRWPDPRPNASPSSQSLAMEGLATRT